MPGEARAAVIVPGIAGAAASAEAVFRAAASFPGAAALPEARTDLTGQLGFDPLDPEALSRAGLDPSRGAALAWFGGQRVLVLPVRDRDDLEALVARLARDRAGATLRSTSRVDGVEVATWSAPGGRPAAALAFHGATALLASGPRAEAAVAAAAGLASGASLAGSAPYQALRRALGDGHAAVAFLPPGSFPLPYTDGAASGAVAAGVSGGGTRLSVVLAALPAEGGSFADLAASSPRAPPLAALASAAATAAWNGDPAALARRLLPLVPPRDREWLADRGIELRRDVFDLLGPGAAGAASLAPGASLSALSPGAFQADPLRLLAFELVAPLRDVEGARAVSARITRLAGRRAAGRDGARFRVATPSGAIEWAIDGPGGRIVLAGGAPGALDALLARLAASPPDPGPPALGAGLGGLALDVPRLVASVRALPPEAFGEGPDAFVIRSLVDRLVEPAGRLAAASLRADLAGDALRVALEVEALPPPAEERR